MSLAARSTAAERMDTECADYEDYRRCLRDLARVNKVTLTHRPMLAWLGRVTHGLERFTLVDVACGHGDALRRVAGWAKRRGLKPDLVGIDLNPWAIDAAHAATQDSAIRFVRADVFAWTPDPRPDFIISSQFAHHLPDAAIVRFLRWMEETAAHGWFLGDLHRHWFPYHGFPLLAHLGLWHRFVRTDGQVSIARSFRISEWERLLAQAGFAPGSVPVSWHVPFRICLARSK
jgi:2-polyprenyl-3-methyl-5-hydroxy-6-metoxy-1,4-benzoquinol methylase